MTGKTGEWWLSFFAGAPFEHFLERKDSQELAQTVDCLWQSLRLSPGDTVFDQCCGTGQLSLPLARRGARVVGVDICQRFIDLARQAADAEQLNCTFVVQDAFDFVPAFPCDAAINWWTSFGYAQDDRRNARMLERAHESLRPGGRFALDCPNLDFVLAAGDISEHYRHETPAGPVLVKRETRIDRQNRLRQQLWTYSMPDGSVLSYDTSLRLYSAPELERMLEGIGFVDINCFGGTDRRPLAPASARLIVLASRGRQ